MAKRGVILTVATELFMGTEIPEKLTKIETRFEDKSEFLFQSFDLQVDWVRSGPKLPSD